jgi:glycosyltransferase involved in cell wall biosynthesis
MERSAHLERLAAASVAVLLPHPSEGFYLPALEAMAIGVALVTPDCVGNRGFCRDGETCLMPAYEANSFAKAALALLRDAALREKLAAAGLHRSEAYSIDRERGEVIALLRRLQL